MELTLTLILVIAVAILVLQIVSIALRRSEHRDFAETAHGWNNVRGQQVLRLYDRNDEVQRELELVQLQLDKLLAGSQRRYNNLGGAAHYPDADSLILPALLDDVVLELGDALDRLIRAQIMLQTARAGNYRRTLTNAEFWRIIEKARELVNADAGEEVGDAA